VVLNLVSRSPPPPSLNTNPQTLRKYGLIFLSEDLKNNGSSDSNFCSWIYSYINEDVSIKKNLALNGKQFLL
jgi:hypothetical protein